MNDSAKILIDLIKAKDQSACDLMDYCLVKNTDCSELDVQREINKVCDKWVKEFVSKHKHLFTDKQAKADLFKYLNSNYLGFDFGKPFSDVLFNRLYKKPIEKPLELIDILLVKLDDDTIKVAVSKGSTENIMILELIGESVYEAYELPEDDKCIAIGALMANYPNILGRITDLITAKVGKSVLASWIKMIDNDTYSNVNLYDDCKMCFEWGKKDRGNALKNVRDGFITAIVVEYSKLQEKIDFSREISSLNNL